MTWMNFKNLLFSLLLISAPSQAVIVDMGDYQYDEQTGLEWLDLSFTDGMSFSEAVDTYSGSGWSIANKGQFSSMYSKYDDPTDASLFGLSTNFSVSGGIQNIRGTGALNAVDLNSFAVDFGLTRNDFRHTLSDSRIDKWSLGYFLDNDDIYLGGTLHINYAADHIQDTLHSYHGLSVSAPSTRYPYNTYYGVFMVRNVTEPSILALSGLGFAGLVFTRRRKKN